MEKILDARGLTEEEAIARYRSRNYPKPAMTADIVVFAKGDGAYRVLLVRRKGHPFIGRLALPGGFANENEPIEETAARELAEETGVEHLQLNLVGLYSNPGRDPRGWVVSAAFAAVVDADLITVRAGDDAAQAGWFTVDGENLICGEESCRFEELAFDHGKILRDALRFLLRSR
jgi:ADP-ribose pyrophosphatase YjhB (NUDIX family)